MSRYMVKTMNLEKASVLQFGTGKVTNNSEFRNRTTTFSWIFWETEKPI